MGEGFSQGVALLLYSNCLLEGWFVRVNDLLGGDHLKKSILLESKKICVVDPMVPCPISFSWASVTLSQVYRCRLPVVHYLLPLLENCLQQTEATCLEILGRLCPTTPDPEATCHWVVTDRHRVGKPGPFSSGGTALWCL